MKKKPTGGMSKPTNKKMTMKQYEATPMDKKADKKELAAINKKKK